MHQLIKGSRRNPDYPSTGMFDVTSHVFDDQTWCSLMMPESLGHEMLSWLPSGMSSFSTMAPIKSLCEWCVVKPVSCFVPFRLVWYPVVYASLSFVRTTEFRALTSLLSGSESKIRAGALSDTCVGLRSYLIGEQCIPQICPDRDLQLRYSTICSLLPTSVGVIRGIWRAPYVPKLFDSIVEV